MAQSGANLPYLGPSEDEAALLEDLQLQEVLLASIKGTSEDTPEKRAGYQAQIRDIKSKLEKLQPVGGLAHNQTNGQALASSSNMNSDSLSFGGVWGHDQDSWLSKALQADQFDPDQSDNAGPSRKRTYSNHINPAQPRLPEGKSRRFAQDARGMTEASSLEFDEDGDDLSSVVDLTGEDDDHSTSVLIQMQKAQEERFSREKQLLEQDASLARQLANDDGMLAGSDDMFANGNDMFGQGPSIIAGGENEDDGAYLSPVAAQAGQPSISPHPSLPSLADAEATPTMSFPGSYLPQHFGPSTNSGPSRLHLPNLARLPIHGPSNPHGVPGYIRPAAPGHGAGPSRMPGSWDNGEDTSSFVYSQPQMTWPAWDQSGHSFAGARPGELMNGSANPLTMGPSQDWLERAMAGDGLTGVMDQVGHGEEYGTGASEEGRRFQEYYTSRDPQKTQEQIRDLLANIAEDDDQAVPHPEEQQPAGLGIVLYAHQKKALAWMKNMEMDDKKKGGLLADDMGLGKTVSTLALMLARQGPTPELGKRVIKTNVVVAPVALIKQWEREINRKVKPQHKLRVYNYHSKAADFETLRLYDVVLTSYGKLASEGKKFEEYIKTVNREGLPIDQTELQKRCPFLGPKSSWFRVVLDEAQCIKNRNTLNAKATFRLKAEYRWVLSGTPMMNSVDELSSLVHFLGIKPFEDIREFQKAFQCLTAKLSRDSDTTSAMTKLHILLKAIMLRRTKLSKIDGKPIIDLPPKTEIVDHVVFNEDEHQYYRDLEQSSQVKFSKFLRAGTVGKHYHNVLVLLLRLRQACCHPFLHITDLDYGHVDIPEDVALELAKSLAANVVRRIKEVEGFECPICYDPVENASIMLPCGHHTCAECLIRLTGNAQAQNIQAGNDAGGNKTTCPECRGPVDENKIITYELFKKVHMPETLPPPPPPPPPVSDDEETESETDSEEETDSDDEASDIDDAGNLKNFVVEDEDEDGSSCSDIVDDVRDSHLERRCEKQNQPKAEKTRKSKEKKKRRSNKSKGKKKEEEIQPHMLSKLRKEARKNAEAHKKYMRYLSKIWLPSAKVSKCTELISEIQSTGEKTIVFSQWTLLLDLLEIQVKSELKLQFRRFDGGMSPVQRDNAVRDFMEVDNVKVILVSLKAGNAGLNLTAASQVIIMDPFWNPYVEMQGVDRAHRIGQQLPVKVHRVLVKGTVEDRIVELQERKRELVDAALDENAVNKTISALSQNDFAFLFGLGPRA